MAESLGGSLPASVDTLVIGAGLAGLALGRRLALSDSDRDVLLLDGRSAYRDDRTWCFWAHPEHDLRHLVSHEWHRWRYDDGASEHVHRVPGRSYQMIRGADFYADARRVIAADAFVHLALGTAVLAVRPAPSPDGDPRVAVTTPSGTVLARHVVDTRPHPTPALLFQCFAGSEIDHGGTLAAGDTTVAGLMTRMRVDDQGFVFTYVLPMTPTTALVELTRFSRRPLPPGAVVAERDAELTAMGLAGATTLRQEGGVLPMGPLGSGPDPVEGAVRAGGSGGGLRRATGYAFQRIQAWAADCAVRMARGEPPVGHPEDGWVQQQMDRIFLQALRGRPERTPEYFLALAGGVAPDRLLRFLTDRATPVDLAAIIASLPLTPFLAQVPDRRRAALAEHEAVVGTTGVTPDRLHR